MINNMKQHTKNINEITEMMTKVRSLNEAISFDEYMDEEDEMTPMEPEMGEVKDCEDNIDMDSETDIDRIREIALKGMLKYVKQSNCAEYETLKKIFQFCDKVNNDKGEEVDKK